MIMEGLLERSAVAGDLAAPEYKVKAAFLYNFVKATDWPPGTFASTNTPITIGILGRDPFGPELEEVIRGKSVDVRGLAVVRFDRVDEVRDCHVLFISSSESGRLSNILSQLADRPILTVGDTRQFARQGGAVGLVKQGDEIRFEVNLEAVESSRLKLSSKLLRLAQIVRSGAGDRKD